MLFFNRENQEYIYISYLPIGKVFKQAWKKGTNFNKFIIWVSKSFEWLVDRYNLHFKGIYICESDFFIDKHKKDYNIPNEIFYATSKDEHRKDIFVLKYLMRGNTEWNFKAIANIYGINISMYQKNKSDGKRFAYKFPIVFYSQKDINIFPIYFTGEFGIKYVEQKILVVEIYREKIDEFVYDFPIQMREEDVVVKMKRIFDKIKQAHVEIEYIYKEPKEEDMIKFCIGD